MLQKQLRTCTKRRYLEEGHGRATFHRAVLDFGLLGKVLGRLNGRHHSLHGEERRQVGRVGRDEDESEEPPDTADDARRRRSWSDLAACPHSHPHPRCVSVSK